MTIMEIAEKYNVPYNTVYLATYGVHGEPYRGREKNYDEKKVVNNLRIVLHEKAEIYSRKSMKYLEMLDRVSAE